MLAPVRADGQFNGMKNDFLWTLLVLLIASACATTKEPAAPVMLGDSEKQALTKRAKAPPTFGLTAYATGDGALFGGAFRLNQNQVGRPGLAAGKNSTAPVIEINRGKALMMIDTSAAESWVTVEASQRLDTTPLAGPELFERKARHVYDTTGGFAAVLPSMTIDSLLVNNALLYVRNARGPLDTLNRWEREPVPDGILGADFVRAFEFVRIGLAGRQIVLSSTAVYPYPDKAITALPLVDLGGGLAVECMMDGEKQIALIDLAGDFEVALERPSGMVMKQVTLGDVVFRQVEVVTALDLGLGLATPPRIGRQLLEKYDLVFNQKGRQLLLELPVK